MRPLLYPVSWMYQGATGLRNWMFDHSLRRVTKVPAKVISVGNVTVGGTGKTPVIMSLIEIMRNKGYSCGVVSRGYMRTSSGVHAVENSTNAPAQFGDEPALVKATFPEVPVVVGEKRVAAAQRLLEGQSVDFVLCDDGFQHRSLHRDLNLLLLDATENQRNYRVLPVGLARESLRGALRRADFVILTKSNLLPPEELEKTVASLKEKSDKPILFAEYQFRSFVSVRGKSQAELKDPVYLISGVARPESVEKTLDGRVKIVKHKIFEDHHRYTNLEVEAILDEASQLQARWILATAKDAIKLKPFHSLLERLWIIDLGVKFQGDLGAFYENLDRLARSRD